MAIFNDSGNSMPEIKTDEFGTSIAYYQSDKAGDYFQSLPEGISRYGNGGFCVEGITSFLTFRYPIHDLTMFQDWRKVAFLGVKKPGFRSKPAGLSE